MFSFSSLDSFLRRASNFLKAVAISYNSVYGDEEESGVNQIEGSGEEVDDVPLTDEQIQAFLQIIYVINLFFHAISLLMIVHSLQYRYFRSAYFCIYNAGLNMENFEDDANNLDLTETVAEDDKLEGFEDHKQKVFSGFFLTTCFQLFKSCCYIV